MIPLRVIELLTDLSHPTWLMGATISSRVLPVNRRIGNSNSSLICAQVRAHKRFANERSEPQTGRASVWLATSRPRLAWIDGVFTPGILWNSTAQETSQPPLACEAFC